MAASHASIRSDAPTPVTATAADGSAAVASTATNAAKPAIRDRTPVPRRESISPAEAEPGPPATRSTVPDRPLRPPPSARPFARLDCSLARSRARNRVRGGCPSAPVPPTPHVAEEFHNVSVAREDEARAVEDYGADALRLAKEFRQRSEEHGELQVKFTVTDQSTGTLQSHSDAGCGPSTILCAHHTTRPIIPSSPSRGRDPFSGESLSLLAHQWSSWKRSRFTSGPSRVRSTNKPSDDPCHPVSRTKPDPRGVTPPAVCDTGHDRATEALIRRSRSPWAQRRVRALRDPREPQDARCSEGGGEEHPILPGAVPR